MIVQGKIVGRDGNQLFVADERGHRLRIPFGLLASGTQDVARNHISQLEGKEFHPAPEKARTVPEPRKEKPQPPKTTKHSPPAKPEPPAVPKTKPEPPTRPPAQVAPRATTTPPIPGQSEPPQAKGPSRKWKIRSGVALAEGRFVEISGPAVRVLTAEGRVTQVPIDLLTDADRQYAETLAQGGSPGELPRGAWEVASDNPRFVAARDRSALLLIDGQKVQVLSPDGTQRTKTHDLGGEIVALAERTEYYVVAIGKELQLFDKQSFKPIAKHELWRYQRIRAIALHPAQLLAYLSVENAREAILRNSDERQRVVVVDEKSGDVGEPRDVFGKFLAVDPAGRFLYVGYGEVYEQEGSVHVNPDGNVIRNPKWQNVDILSRFRIDGKDLAMDEMFQDAGANGQGVVLSPDGRRITYLSYTGYPTFSGNVVALEAGNFKKNPTNFPMKDKSDCRRLVYHPVLPLVASPTKGGAVLYSVETGSSPGRRGAAAPEMEARCRDRRA